MPVARVADYCGRGTGTRPARVQRAAPSMRFSETLSPAGAPGRLPGRATAYSTVKLILTVTCQ